MRLVAGSNVLRCFYFFHVLLDCNLKFEINISYGFGNIRAINLLCNSLWLNEETLVTNPFYPSDQVFC